MFQMTKVTEILAPPVLPKSVKHLEFGRHPIFVYATAGEKGPKGKRGSSVLSTDTGFL